MDQLYRLQERFGFQASSRFDTERERAGAWQQHPQSRAASARGNHDLNLTLSASVLSRAPTTEVSEPS